MSLALPTMSNHPSWVPDQSNWYNQWETSLTWKIRIQSLIEQAESEIHKIHEKYISHIKDLNNEISITKSTILSKDGTIKKQNDDLFNLKKEREEMSKELENESSIIMNKQEEIVNLTKEVETLNLEIKSQKSRFKALRQLYEIKASQYLRSREIDQKEIDHLSSNLLKQKTITSKALNDKKLKHDEYLQLLSETNALKLAFNEVEKERKDLKKKNSDLEQEKTQLSEKFESTNQLLDNEKKKTELFKSHLKTLSQQLNIPDDLYFQI